jgi:DNA-binding HxlR family transcriptional regulator
VPARTGISTSVAARRLRELVAAGILARQSFREPGQRVRVEYVLTDAGRDLLPVMVALTRWAEAHVGGDGRPRHLCAGCGAADVARMHPRA